MNMLTLYEQAKRSEWMRAARTEFKPGPRQCCEVCGEHKSISQAHHVIPLAAQYDRDYIQPDHDFKWLCPNHHVYIHRLLAVKNHMPAVLDMGLQILKPLLAIITEDTAMTATLKRIQGHIIEDASQCKNLSVSSEFE